MQENNEMKLGSEVPKKGEVFGLSRNVYLEPVPHLTEQPLPDMI
jgi:hypothetical protein